MPTIRVLPLLLYSYVAAELLAPFFASFLILYAIFFLVRLTPMLETVLELGIGLADFIRLSAYIFPYMLLYVIPMASMTGVIIGFTRLTADREILALKSCGVSLRQLLPPVILMALAISSVTGFFSVRLIPAGEMSLRQLMLQLAKEKLDKGLQEKTFTEALGDLVVYVEQIDKDGTWHDVYVSDMRGREQPIITMARSGHMESELGEMRVIIVLQEGTMHHTDGLDNQIVKFDRYQLKVPLNAPGKVDETNITALSRGAMSQRQLLQAAAATAHDSKKSMTYLTEYHHRLVLPVGCFLLSLLGMPLGLQAGPGRRAVGIPLGLGFFVLYYVAFTACRVLCEDMVLPVVFGMWLPNFLFLGLTVFIFWRVEQEKSLVPVYVQNLIALIHERVMVPLGNFLVRRAKELRRRRRSASQPPAGAAVMLVRGDSHGLVYHFPECDNYHCKHCTIEFKDAGVATKAGFEPCGFCRTLLSKYTK